MRPDDDAGARGDDARTLFVANAGLVLLSPFFVVLFRRLGLLPESGTTPAKIESSEGRSRAVHLLQYLVDGRVNASGSTLTLNKLICGVPLGQEVEPGIEISEYERETCDRLLEAVIAKMAIVTNVSVHSLQKTFFQREGKLSLGEKRWDLVVNRRSFDLILNRLPWNFTIVYYPVMVEPIYVTWPS